MGQICQSFGWTFQYLYEEIDWRIVQRMIIDSPSIEDEKGKKDKKKTVIDLSEQTSEDFLKNIL